MSEAAQEELVDDPAPPAGGQPKLAPSLQHAAREAEIWAEVIDGYARNAKADAIKAEVAGDGPRASECLQSVADWQFRADALRRGSAALQAIVPHEDKVRTLLKAENAKAKAAAAKPKGRAA